MTRLRFLSVVALLFALFVAGCGKSPRTATKPAKDRKLAPDFALKDADGKTLKLSDLRGKVVLLNFWATWCNPCQVEIPWFIEFEQKYKDRGFEVVGVSMDEDGWKAVKPFIRESKINYRIAIGDDTVGQLYGGLDALPTTFVIDRDGRVAASHVGLTGKKNYQDEIVSLLDSASADSGTSLHAARRAD